MSYNVSLIASLGAPRNHHALFVETSPSSGGGIILQVTGNIQSGMVFEEKPTDKPEDSADFEEKTYLGNIAVEDIDRMREICRGNPPPKKQFNGPKRLHPNEPLRRCQEWTRETIAMLLADGVLSASD